MSVSPVSSGVAIPVEPKATSKITKTHDIDGGFAKALDNVRGQKKVANTSSDILSISNKQAKGYMSQAIKQNPNLGDSYQKIISNSRSDQFGEDGTKIALKDLAKKFENQIYSMMWNGMIKKEDGTLAERVWYPQLIEAYVESGEEELSEIGEAVYEEMLEEVRLKAKQNFIQ